MHESDPMRQKAHTNAIAVDTEVWPNTYVLCKCLTQMRLFISLYAKIRCFRKRLEGQKRPRNQSRITITLLMLLLGSSCLKENNEDWVRGVWLGNFIAAKIINEIKVFSNVFFILFLWAFASNFFHSLFAWFTRPDNGTTELHHRTISLLLHMI